MLLDILLNACALSRCFRADYNGDGYVSREEMISYLNSVFTVMLSLDASMEEATDQSSLELAVAATEQCFADADVNRDGLLSLNEFKRWYSSADVSDAGASARNVVVEAAKKPGWLSVNVVRSVTTLHEIPLDELARHFAQFTEENGTLSRASFNAAFYRFSAQNAGVCCACPLSAVRVPLWA